MLFSSVPFLFYFLPAVLLVYFLVPKRAKNGVLLLSSLVFYGWGEPRYLPVMLVSILQGYIFGRLIERFRDTRRAKLFLVLSVLLSLGTLAYFKYADFMIANLNALTGLSAPLLRLALPVGISFYTFQILSYTVDVYRGTVPAQRNFIDLAAYIAMFPQLIAGPIVRYSDITVQLKTREHSVSEAASGARRFILGLAKKILLANLLGELVSSFRASADLSVLYYWLGAIAFTLQIYYDFSGYSDMAIGLGRIFGFRFPENFQYPYLSGSITEFWRRWHISLGSWFRDYLYIPLGGNRKGSARQLLNILLVWLATGLWHGAAWNFVVWGLLNAFFILLAEEFKPVSQRFRAKHERLVSGFGYRVFETLRTFLLMCSLRVLDCYRDVEVSFRALGTVFTDFNWGEAFSGALLQLGLTGADYLIAAVGVVIMFAVSCVQEKHGSVREVLWEKPVLCYAVFFVLAVAVLTFGAYGVGYDAAQFIYNQF